MKIKPIAIFTCLLFFITINSWGQRKNSITQQEKLRIEQLQEVTNLYLLNNKNLKAAKTYTQIGFMFWKGGEPRYAIDNFLEAAKIFEAIKKYEEAKKTYSNIGVIYTDFEDMEMALKYFEKSLKMSRKTRNKTNIASGLIDVSYILQILKFYDDAIKHLEEALNLSIEINNARLIYDCYQMLAFNYKKIGNVKKAEELMQKAKSFQKFIDDESIKEEYASEVIETQQEVVRSKEEKRLAAQLYALQKQITEQEKDSLNLSLRAKQDSLTVAAQKAKQRQQAIKLLEQEKELSDIKMKEQEAREQKQKLLILMITGGFLLMIVIAVIMLKANRQRKKANNQLEKHNKEIDQKNTQLGEAIGKIANQNKSITQSINYAQNIQKALLPKAKQLRTIMKDSFIFFKPRDIVSGDFYWFKKINIKENDKDTEKIIITAVDCTGHGVPGAFMSMIGFNLINGIINNKIIKSNEILSQLHEGIHFSLNQGETNNQDGMDMALCVFDEKNKMLEYAGAQNPLVYIQDDEVKQIKGDRLGIGGKEPKREYVSHTINIDRPTYCYIFSDGFIDQFGGDKGRKFMIKKFREFLLSIHKKPMSEQQKMLDEKLKEWTGTKYSQVDDILVIGFKIG